MVVKPIVEIGLLTEVGVQHIERVGQAKSIGHELMLDLMRL